MITTEREYRITKARIANPERAIARERARTNLTPLMRQMYVDALTSNLEGMAAEVRAYEDLKAGRVQIRSASLAELPTVLIPSPGRSRLDPEVAGGAATRLLPVHVRVL